MGGDKNEEHLAESGSCDYGSDRRPQYLTGHVINGCVGDVHQHVSLC